MQDLSEYYVSCVATICLTVRLTKYDPPKVFEVLGVNEMLQFEMSEVK
jgi:hypothetical protein